MALTLRSAVKPRWYKPVGEDGDNPMRFKLRTLNRGQLDQVMEGRFVDESHNLQLSAKGIDAALKFGVLDWENVNDEDGCAVDFHVSKLADIPWELGVELATEITNGSFMSEEDLGNFA